MEILARVTNRLGGLPCWVLLGLVMIPEIMSGQSVDEYEVKAAFLFNFTKFVEWPKNDSDAFNICILGDDPFGPNLDELVKGKVANGKKLQIRRLKDAPEAKQCQIVYVRGEEKNKASQVIDAVQKMPVLTVGERSAFGKMGGIVYLTMMDDHVGVGINAAAAESSGLKISAKLLSLAKSSKDGER
jgi:YfiR/HmsC-like